MSNGLAEVHALDGTVLYGSYISDSGAVASGLWRTREEYQKWGRYAACTDPKHHTHQPARIICYYAWDFALDAEVCTTCMVITDGGREYSDFDDTVREKAHEVRLNLRDTWRTTAAYQEWRSLPEPAKSERQAAMVEQENLFIQTLIAQELLAWRARIAAAEPSPTA